MLAVIMISITCVLRTNTGETTEVMFHQSHYCLLKTNTGKNCGCRDDDLSYICFVLKRNTGGKTKALFKEEHH